MPVGNHKENCEEQHRKYDTDLLIVGVELRHPISTRSAGP